MDLDSQLFAWSWCARRSILRKARLKDYLEASVRSLSESIASELFALVCRDIHNLRNPKAQNTLAMIYNADALLQSHATMIQKAIFPHRKYNPIPQEKLLDVLNSHVEHEITIDELERILTAVTQRNLVPGLIYDGYEIFLSEEHASWKAEIH